ncbi:hypothetical protein MKX01_004441 [Papaver californicum]|nr:hypothetical protein MKX01_004441 [Papaver californicum]
MHNTTTYHTETRHSSPLIGSLPSPPSPRAPASENSVSNFKFMPNWIAYYDPSTNTWSQVRLIPGLKENQIIKGFSMVSIGYYIFIIGGRLCKYGVLHDSQDVEGINIKVLSTIQRYDTLNDIWSTCTPLGVPRFDFARTICDNKIYVAGGQSTSGCARGIRSAEMYDPDVDLWTNLPKMTTLRYKSAGVTWEGKIHVVGGFAEREDSGQPVLYTMLRSSAEVFDPCRGEWDLFEGMWKLDIPPNQTVAVDGKLFSSGDCLNTWKGHIEVYDGDLKIWNIMHGSKVQNLSSLISTMAPIGTQLYFVAGYLKIGEVSGLISVVHAFDTSVGADPSWNSSEPIEEKADNLLCCVVQVP